MKMLHYILAALMICVLAIPGCTVSGNVSPMALNTVQAASEGGTFGILEETQDASLKADLVLAANAIDGVAADQPNLAAAKKAALLAVAKSKYAKELRIAIVASFAAGQAYLASIPASNATTQPTTLTNVRDVLRSISAGIHEGISEYDVTITTPAAAAPAVAQ